MHAHDLDRIPSLAPRTTPSQGMATVVRVDQTHASWWLRRDGELEFQAQRAASCMLSPGVGDSVWFAREGQHAFVLAVLTCASETPSRLTVPGDLELEAGGELRLHGRAGVELSTPARLGLRSDELDVTARESTLTFAKLRASANEVFAALARVTHVGQLLELLVDTVRQRSRSSYRAIAEIEHVQAKLINHEAHADIHINAQRALINGEDIIKMDGGQIHLG